MKMTTIRICLPHDIVEVDVVAAAEEGDGVDGSTGTHFFPFHPHLPSDVTGR
jgi:hypothetical protein